MAFGDKYKKEKAKDVENKVPVAIPTTKQDAKSKSTSTIPTVIQDAVKNEVTENQVKKLRQKERIASFNRTIKNKIAEEKDDEPEQKDDEPEQKSDNKFVKNNAAQERIRNFLKNTRNQDNSVRKKRKGLLGIEYDNVLFSFAKIRIIKTWEYYDQSNVCMQVQCFCQEYYFDVTDEEIIDLVQRAHKEVKSKYRNHHSFEE